jgi:hypothetical protein
LQQSTNCNTAQIATQHKLQQSTNCNTAQYDQNLYINFTI